MGIVLNQSIKNTVITYLGFGLGAINILFLYTNYLTEEYFGLVAYILSVANILMPLMAFGVHNTIVKFYSSFKTRLDQQNFLTVMLFLPLFLIIPLAAFTNLAHNQIAEWISKENPITKNYIWLIYVTAIAFAYFEVLYAWSKVQLQSVFGNFIKEVFHRVAIMLLLFAHHFKYITVDEFIYSITVVYFIRLLIMAIYAFSLQKPTFNIRRIPNLISIIKYSALIIIAGSVALIILEIDKFMIGQFVPSLSNVAYYSVAIFIATVIDVPQRAMQQIVNPLTAEYLNAKNYLALNDLYRKSSITLLIISGLILVLILVNIKALYLLLPNNYSEGLFVVFIIGIAKLFNSVLGNNNSILFYSNYYRMVLVFGVLAAIITVVSNIILIPILGLNGAALASCITIFIYNTIKLVFVKIKFKLSPFSIKSIQAFLIMTACFLSFYFWDILEFPVLSIIIKSGLCSLIFLVSIYKMKLSEDINGMIDSTLNLINKKTFK